MISSLPQRITSVFKNSKSLKIMLFGLMINLTMINLRKLNKLYWKLIALPLIHNPHLLEPQLISILMFSHWFKYQLMKQFTYLILIIQNILKLYHFSEPILETKIKLSLDIQFQMILEALLISFNFRNPSAKLLTSKQSIKNSQKQLSKYP